MKKFGVIFQYELMNYIKNKSYVITTVIIALVAGIIMFVPNFIDIGSVTGENKNDVSDENSGADSDSTILVYDKSGMVTDISFIQNFYHDDAIKKASGENELVDKVKADEVSAGFVVNSLTDYDYYVYNQSMTDDNQVVFTQVMTVLNQMVYCQKNGIDYASLTQAFNPQIDCHENILGKDMGSNYWYCYGLVMIIFMIIIMYGSMVATSVTQEKSNRTMEVLVTSVDTNLLFFAKVLAGAVAALIQSAVMLGTVLISYKINQDKWGGMLNMVLDIPANVIVYFITLASLTNVDGIMIKVTSFLPVSSYSAMFARVAMGSVNTWEIVVSFIILVASIVVVGIIGAKIYRMGTLRYGNPIKLSNAFKSIKEN